MDTMLRLPAEATEVIKRLNENYPGAGIGLKYNNPIELLVATILSAQCTDGKVNQVTKSLFKKYRSVGDYATADPEQFEQDIRPTGFYRNKSKNIMRTAAHIQENFGGQVPKTMTELISLPGVARKTANIVLFNAYGIISGIAVDTHVGRLSQRLGLSKYKDPVKIEQDLMSQITRAEWGHFSYLLIEHGRAICSARKPRCHDCPLNDICPSAFEF
jgi:endonuclease-3